MGFFVTKIIQMSQVFSIPAACGFSIAIGNVGLNDKLNAR